MADVADMTGDLEDWEESYLQDVSDSVRRAAADVKDAAARMSSPLYGVVVTSTVAEVGEYAHVVSIDTRAVPAPGAVLGGAAAARAAVRKKVDEEMGRGGFDRRG